MSAGGLPRFVVLDDDPTGVQTLAGVRVLLAWDEGRIRDALAERRAVHLVTNARALPAERVQPLIEDAARAARKAVPDAHLVLRGDSTLRGHLREEYLGVRNATVAPAWPVLLLAPALPSAGRITVAGVHLFERDGARVPLHDTEYSRDGVFAYGSARLLEWAEERSGGLFRAGAGRELHVDALRSVGAAAVAGALADLEASAEPAVLAPDAETADDLELIAEGYARARESGVRVLVRCAPALAGVLAGTTATTQASFPDGRGGVLLVCGSYVPLATRQLARLVASLGHDVIEADMELLAGAAPEAEIERLATEASRALGGEGVAVLATPRIRPEWTASLEVGERIASNLARTVAALDVPPPVLVVKGGITSAVTLRDGVGAAEVEVVGPVAPGVSRWRASWSDGRPLDYLVVPGNVGDDDLLARLVIRLMGGSSPC